MKIMVINGPNLNLLGIRETEIYGRCSYADLEAFINQQAKMRKIEVSMRQSNHEGNLIDWIQEAFLKAYDGIIINPGAYAHTSIALADAVHGIAPLPVVEVHLSDILKREDYRCISYMAPYCIRQISGNGFMGYAQAMDELSKSRRKTLDTVLE